MTPFVRPLPCSIAEALGEDPAPTPQRADGPVDAVCVAVLVAAVVLIAIFI